MDIHDRIIMKGRRSMKKKKGFTLIELIAALVIMAILALIVTPLVLNIAITIATIVRPNINIIYIIVDIANPLLFIRTNLKIIIY